MALNAEVFPHDSADLPRAGPGRMCSAAPTVPRTAHWARHRRPDTPDPAARATTPRGSPEKPRPGVRPRRRSHPTTLNPASESRRLLGGRWCGGGVRLLVWWQFPRGRRRVHGGALLLGPLRFRWTTCVRLDHLRAVGPPYFVNQVVQRNSSGPTAFKWSKRTGCVTTCETPSHHAGRPTGRGTGTAPRRMRPAPFSPRCPPRSREQRSEPPSRERNTLPTPGGARGRAPRPARTSPWWMFSWVRPADRGARRGRRPARGIPPGARGGAGCPNLLQRLRSSRNTERESLVFRAFFCGRSRSGAPLQQIWTRLTSGRLRSPTRITAYPHIPIAAPIRAHGSVTPGKKGSTASGTPARSIPVVAGPVPAVIRADLTDSPLDPSRR